MVTRADLTGTRPLNLVEPTVPVRTANDRHQETFNRLAQISLGKQIQAEVLAQLGKKNFLIGVEGTEARVNLPEGTKVGDQLPMTMLAHQPRPTLLLGAKPQTEATTLSSAARLIASLLQGNAEDAADLVVQARQPVLPAAPVANQSANVPQLAAGLRAAVQGSGLFYESHLQQWTEGQRPLVNVMREPQALGQRAMAPLATALPALARLLTQVSNAQSKGQPLPAILQNPTFLASAGPVLQEVHAAQPLLQRLLAQLPQLAAPPAYAESAPENMQAGTAQVAGSLPSAAEAAKAGPPAASSAVEHPDLAATEATALVAPAADAATTTPPLPAGADASLPSVDTPVAELTVDPLLTAEAQGNLPQALRPGERPANPKASPASPAAPRPVTPEQVAAVLAKLPPDAFPAPTMHVLQAVAAHPALAELLLFLGAPLQAAMPFKDLAALPQTHAQIQKAVQEGKQPDTALQPLLHETPTPAPPASERPSPGHPPAHTTVDSLAAETALPTDADTLMATEAHPLVADEMLPTIRQQLDVLENRHVQWSGELWPGKRMDWEIRQEKGRSTGGQAGEEQEAWTSSLRVHFPALGDVSAHISLTEGHVRMWVRVPHEDTAHLLRVHTRDLADALALGGTQLDALLVNRDE